MISNLPYNKYHLYKQKIKIEIKILLIKFIANADQIFPIKFHILLALHNASVTDCNFE